MDDDTKWLEVFSPEEYEELSAKMDKLVYYSETLFNITTSWTIQQCIEVVYHYHKSINSGEQDESWEITEGFLAYFIDFITSFLEDEGIDWREEF